MSLVFNTIIDFIFKAVFFIKARVNINLYGMVFCYGFEILLINLLSLRIEPFWGGQLYCKPIGLSRG